MIGLKYKHTTIIENEKKEEQCHVKDIHYVSSSVMMLQSNKSGSEEHPSVLLDPSSLAINSSHSWPKQGLRIPTVTHEA